MEIERINGMIDLEILHDSIYEFEKLKVTQATCLDHLTTHLTMIDKIKKHIVEKKLNSMEGLTKTKLYTQIMTLKQRYGNSSNRENFRQILLKIEDHFPEVDVQQDFSDFKTYWDKQFLDIYQ